MADMTTRKKTGTKTAEPKKKRGRPSSYREEYAEQAKGLCLLGATNEELAKFFGVAVSTISVWQENPEFSDALKEGKEGADARVATSLYQQAISGNVTACIFWLKNRRKLNWRDKVEAEVSGDINVNIVRFTDADDNPSE